MSDNIVTVTVTGNSELARRAVAKALQEAVPIADVEVNVAADSRVRTPQDRASVLSSVLVRIEVEP